MPEVVEVSLLEKTLSLSKNGGVYYGGARVEADKRSAVLFVGLGGSGADALIRVKDQIKTRMILPSDETGTPIADAPKSIGFLEIDTDETVQNITYGSARFDPFGKEFCDISVTSVPDVIADILKAKKEGVECWQWFDEGINQVSGAKGAGGVRQIGRMLLANNIGKVVSSVEGKISSLITDNPDISNLLIYVFSGISGGTGAGTFLDMAYILQKTAKRKIPDVNMMGCLIMTDVNELNGGKVEMLRTNGFSCLKELDYWMSSGDHKERYQQIFKNGFELNELAAPFDFCHLLDASDAKGHQFRYDKILRTIAETAFTYVTGEIEGSDSATGTMGQMYNNIKAYILALTESADYPACYDYLSLGSSKIEIPYTEISTLIAARVFERLSEGMFKNRPTEDGFNKTVYSDLEMTEESIRSALYRNVNVPRPNLNKKGYKYADVWPNNAPYHATHNWLALFQRSVVEQAGNLPAYLEGKLKTFIRSNLRSHQTGPIYLRYFMKSNQTYCLYNMLEAFRKYCRQLQTQCAGKSRELKELMQQAYAEGAHSGMFSKDSALKNYLASLEAWYINEEHGFLNEKIAEVIETLQTRIQLYYENILRPLSDMLLEIPEIFGKNVEYIRVNETKVDEGTDILIRPLEFEKSRRNDFEAAVVNAEQEFLDSLADNIHKWIGRDIDEVDSNIATSADIGGFISMFISEHFSNLLTINMEAVMNTRLKNGESLENYIRARVDELIQRSYPMYKETTGLSGSVEEFAILSVPRDCPIIYQVAKAHIAAKGELSKYISVKRSEEKSRLYIIKVASGYPLYSNAFLKDMEIAYEGQMGNTATSVGKHLKPEWGMRLPSPNIELIWKVPYECKRTKERNKKYRGYFERCYRNKIVVKNEDSTYQIRCARKEVAEQVNKASLTAPTILEKMEQFEKIKARLWEGGESIQISTCSRYKRGQENGELENVRENILRFPGMLEILESECKLADAIEQIEEELHYPKYFELANINHMIYVKAATGDTVYRRTETDPFPIILAKGQEMQDDFKEYQIFRSFCKKLNVDIKDEIELQYENLKTRIETSEKVLEEYVAEIKERIKGYKEQEAKARDKMYLASSEDRPAFLEKIEFYQGAVEEMIRMLPPGIRESVVKELLGEVPEEVSAPPRYLNPGTWQPVMNPQPGQMVFDTQMQQMIAYQPPVYPGGYPGGAAQPGAYSGGVPQAGGYPGGAAQPGAYSGGVPQAGGYPGGAAQPGAYSGGVPQAGGYPGGAAQPGAYSGGVPQAGGYPGGAAQPGAYPGGVPQAGGYPGVAAQPGAYPGEAAPGGNYPGGMQPGGYPGVAAQGGYPGVAAQPGGYPGGVPQGGGYPGGMQPGGYPGGAAQPGGYPGGMQPGGYPGGAAQPVGYPGGMQPGDYPGGVTTAGVPQGGAYPAGMPQNYSEAAPQEGYPGNIPVSGYPFGDGNNQ